MSFFRNLYKKMKIDYLEESAGLIPEKYHSQFVCLGGASEIHYIFSKVIPPPEKNVLIIGIYGGREFFYFKLKGYNVYAFDLCLDNHFKNDIGDVQRLLPYPDCFFDVVVINEVLEHLQEDFKALLNIRRVLKDDGILFISVPFLSDEQNDHIRVYTKKSMIRLLNSAGFSVNKYFERPNLFFAPQIFNYCHHAINALFFILFNKTIYRFSLPLFHKLEFVISQKNIIIRRFFNSFGGFFVCKKEKPIDYININIKNYF